MTSKKRAHVPVEDHLPLTPATFQILMALAEGERHGYAIMTEVAERSEGTIRLGPGTLYGTLKRLLEGGMVEETEGAGEGPDERRRYYRLTSYGVRVARAEARRLESVVRSARGKRLLGAEPA
jgi:Predicted transcriptional regulators